ncbi:MAG: hypothetical protein FWG40_02300 [Peptococcaceae bacterium]|nr:hypothetical protein [Peptococcaceae bacterium]
MRSSSKIIGLLLEIILSTVFFAIICVVVLQIFMQTQKIEQLSRDKSGAIVLAQTVGDMFRSQMPKGLDDYAFTLRSRYLQAYSQVDERHFVISLDEEKGANGRGWFASIEVDEITSSPVGKLSRAVIRVQKSGNVLFELNVDSYSPDRGMIRVENQGSLTIDDE